MGTAEQTRTTLDTLRTEAQRLYGVGDEAAAIKLQMRLVAMAERSGEILSTDYSWFGMWFFNNRDFINSASAYTLAQKLKSDCPILILNLALSLVQSNQTAKALPYLKEASLKNPNDLNVLGGFAIYYYHKGDMNNVRKYGERILTIKDKKYCVANKNKYQLIPGQPVKPFRADHPKENIISFSLFGSRDKYLVGAVKNVIATPELYPGWTCRFYCGNDVPKDTLKILKKKGAEIKIMPARKRFFDGLFWRFLVAEDPSVARFLIRDCDSVINIRERNAVTEWIDSGQPFHLMRDGSTHFDLIMAGMWGGVGGILPPLATLLHGFSYSEDNQRKVCDQLFLGQVVWPIIKNHCLIHDSVFQVFGSKPFPANSELPIGRNVGDNDHGFREMH